MFSLSPVSQASYLARTTHSACRSDCPRAAQSSPLVSQPLLDKRSPFWATWCNIYTTAFPLGRKPVVLQACLYRGLYYVILQGRNLDHIADLMLSTHRGPCNTCFHSWFQIYCNSFVTLKSGLVRSLASGTGGITALIHHQESSSEKEK